MNAREQYEKSEGYNKAGSGTKTYASCLSELLKKSWNRKEKYHIKKVHYSKQLPYMARCCTPTLSLDME